MRTLVVLVAVLLGLAGGAAALYEGWDVPAKEVCGGDVCLDRPWYDVDWARLNAGVAPRRIACFEANPGPRSVVIGPGAECVRARGDGVVERRVTYEQLRGEIRDRRLRSLLFAAAFVLLLPAAALRWRLRPGAGPTGSGRPRTVHP